MKRKEYGDDDGRVISNMNVEGAPWYVERRGDGGGASGAPPSALGWRDTLSALSGALAAGLLIGLAFVGSGLVFILFCLHVWFR